MGYLSDIEIAQQCRMKHITEIAEKAFDCCKDLKSVVIPESVTEIEVWAFRYSKLTNVAVSKNTIIGKDVFECLYDNPKINYI